ncbi:MAG: rod shape-determining protein MreC [Novosphingobium sp.]|nr:rod shape-determining protein MreC [Novosphingobium sp.]
MAPSANRRPGYSRRAQYSTFFGYIAGVLGALVGAALLIVSFVDPGMFAGVRGVAADAAEPAGQVAADSRNAGRGLISVVEAYFRAGSQNVELRKELRKAKVKLAEADAVVAENKRLKALLKITETNPDPVAVTQITSSTASSTRRLATIGAGADKGVATGMPVRSLAGLIGRVLEVGRSTSRVLLVTDSESVVPVRRAKDGIPAFAQGVGNGTLKIRLISLGINPLKKGDIFVTSGSGGLYRPGTAIAVVSLVTSDGAIGRVLSDPAATEYVIVERAWAPPAPVASQPAPSDNGEPEA